MKIRMAVLTLGMATATAVGCISPKDHHLPPAEQLMHPGPGVDGPGPGVMIPGGGGPATGFHSSTMTSQVAFINPDGMTVHWDIGAPGLFDSEPLVVPGRQNFSQGAIYRLKLTNIPGRAGVELYPTLEVGPTTPRTDAYVAHNAVPVELTDEDLDQVVSGNFVTKVIFLPDPEFQELALAGVETLVSTRLDPGVDPIVEADRRGAILAILRLGNKDLEVPGTMDQAGAAIVPAAHSTGEGAVPTGGPLPVGAATSGYAPAAMPPGYVSGVSTPHWGMPMSGTPIGLPGPPHIPLGVPAGLQKHTIKNKTMTKIPGPTKQFKMTVKQKPPYTYPKPVNRVRITESLHSPPVPSRKPLWNKKRSVNVTDDCVGGDCN